MRALLRIRDVRLLLLGQAVSQAGDWLYSVALVVYVVTVTDSPAWVAAASLVRLVPWILFGPLGGLVADRFDRRRVLIASDLAQLAGMLVLMAATVAGAPPGVAIGIAGLVAMAGIVADPSLQAALPNLVDERRLVAVNALLTSIVSLSMVVGPAIAAVLLVLGSPAAAFGVNALTFAVSATCVLAVRTPLGPVPSDLADTTAAPSPGSGSALGRAGRELAEGVRVVAASPVAAALLLVASAIMLAYGAQVVLWAVLADTKLAVGADGLTLLYVAYGIGGLLATIPASRAATDRSGGLVLVAGAMIGGVAIAALAVPATVAPAVVLLVAQGLVVTVVDVLVITLLQRVLGAAVLGRAVGAMNSLTSITMVIGSVLAPLLVTTIGLEGAFAITGLVLVAAGAVASVPVLGTARQRRGIDPVIAARTQVLADLSLFRGAPRYALEGLAAECHELTVGSGEVLIREGDPADALFVLTEGAADVTTEATGVRPLTVLRPGDFFGEIGLLKRVPRTATVTANGPCRLLRMDGDAFLAMVGAGVTHAGVLGSSVGLRLARGGAGVGPDQAVAGRDIASR